MCSYCAFNTYTDLEALIPDFVQALVREVEFLGKSNPGYEVHTVFFGGGTPSLLSPKQYDALMHTIHGSFRVVSDAEISIETNPNDLSTEYLRSLRAIGLNRLSIGMQSANSHVLRLFNRGHDQQMVIQAVEAGRRAGFDNISLDLIFGVPGQTLDDWQKTLDAGLGLDVEHFSTYGLELKGGTLLTEQVRAGEVAEPDDDIAADMYDWMTERFAAAGYEQYELSNWCKPGYEARHNLQYWHIHPYLGLGPGAHGYVEHQRTIVLRHPQKYIERMRHAPDVMAFPESPATSKLTKVDRTEEMSDVLMMGLRLTRDGVQRQAFQQRFGVDPVALHEETIEKFVGYGLLSVDQEAIRLTQRGRLLSNAVIRELI